MHVSLNFKITGSQNDEFSYFLTCKYCYLQISPMKFSTEKVEVLNSGLKTDNSKLNLYLIDIKRKNCEKKETVNEMEVWINS